jgi:hypothetical protein
MTLGAVLTGVLPSIGVLAIFIYAMRGITRGDRREREAMAEFDRQEAQAAARLAAAGREESGTPAP